MVTLIDTSLWIDFTRTRSPRELKQLIAPYILHPEAHLAEPVTFEVLRHATPEENRQLTQHFQTFPLLETPTDLWPKAACLGQACRKQGISTGSLDLLIASVALHYIKPRWLRLTTISSESRTLPIFGSNSCSVH